MSLRRPRPKTRLLFTHCALRTVYPGIKDVTAKRRCVPSAALVWRAAPPSAIRREYSRISDDGQAAAFFRSPTLLAQTLGHCTYRGDSIRRVDLPDSRHALRLQLADVEEGSPTDALHNQVIDGDLYLDAELWSGMGIVVIVGWLFYV